MRILFGAAAFFLFFTTAHADRCTRFVIDEHRTDTWMLRWNWFSAGDQGPSCTAVIDPLFDDVTKGRCAASLPVQVDGLVVMGEPVFDRNLITEYRVCIAGGETGGQVMRPPQKITSPFATFEFLPKGDHLVDYPDGTRVVPVELRPLTRLRLSCSADGYSGAYVELETPRGVRSIEVAADHDTREEVPDGVYRVLSVQFIPGLPQETTITYYPDLEEAAALSLDGVRIKMGAMFALQGTKTVELVVAR